MCRFRSTPSIVQTIESGVHSSPNTWKSAEKSRPDPTGPVTLVARAVVGPPVHGHVFLARDVTEDFLHVDLVDARAADLAQQPERGPQALAGRNLQARFEVAVLLLVHRAQHARGVLKGLPGVAGGAFVSDDRQDAVLKLERVVDVACSSLLIADWPHL